MSSLLGCTFAELLLREPLFFVDIARWSQIGQMKAIFQLLGTPEEARWPGCSDLPGYVQFQKVEPTPMDKFFKGKRAQASLHRIQVGARG